jgi:glycerate kinase
LICLDCVDVLPLAENTSTRQSVNTSTHQQMNILIAPDKFKGTLTAIQVAKAIEKGILKTDNAHHISIQPMADGGDGSIDLLNSLHDLTPHYVTVNDPLFRPISAVYFTNMDTAFIEMSKASGLALLKKEEHNCLKTTSLGTGEMILDAYQKGFKNIKLFIGGSATNDAAIGIATALGYTFLDENGFRLSPIGENLIRIKTIEKSTLSDAIRELNIEVVCDVDNPFFGQHGAAYTFAKQKGADENAIKFLDNGLQNLNQIFIKSNFSDVQKISGAGAAGGVGGGMIALFNAQHIAGINLFINLFDLENQIKNADLIITGEGRLDSQSFDGKVVGGIYKLCQKHDIPMAIACGQYLEYEAIETKNLAIYTVIEKANSLSDAMENSEKYLEAIGSELVN